MKKDYYTDTFEKVSNLKEERCTRMLERREKCIYLRSKNEPITAHFIRFDFELEVASCERLSNRWITQFTRRNDAIDRIASPSFREPLG